MTKEQLDRGIAIKEELRKMQLHCTNLDKALNGVKLENPTARTSIIISTPHDCTIRLEFTEPGLIVEFIERRIDYAKSVIEDLEQEFKKL